MIELMDATTVTVLEREKKLLTRRNFLKAAGAGIIGLPLYAAEISRHEISIERRTIRLDRLPDTFRGLRIVQISDFHYAEFTEPLFLREIVYEVNRLKADIVVFNGDYVTEGPVLKKWGKDFAHKCAEILNDVKCPLRYSVLGNHDSGDDEPAVIDALDLFGLNLLNNSFMPLERDGKRLWFAGAGDAYKKKMDLDKAIPPASRIDGEPVILLAHEPDVLPEVAQKNVDLMLSGHTHGGQVRFPFVPPIHLPPLGRKYVEGWFRLGPTQLYVNRGIGTVNLPFRFNCPPEITEITLA
jgi:uncharacterized protein